MRLQELKKKEDVTYDEAMGKRVRVFLQPSFYVLDGDWQWEMESDAVFCSDVMLSLPEEFIGTKAIIHPSDVAAVRQSLAEQQTVPALNFRIITTYGQVKILAGENIVVVEEMPDNWPDEVVQAAAQTREQKAGHQHLQLLKDLDDRTSRFSGTGRWYYNSITHQAWYSDFVYHLHGLPPQSVNAYLHTFHPFVHPEDRAFVTEFTDKAFREQAPLYMDYRIVVGDTEKWVSYRAQWFCSEKGEPVLGGIFQDITAQKLSEQEAESYKNLVQFQRQQALYDEQQVNFGHWQVALLTRKTTYSDHYYRIFGLKPQSLTATINAFINFVHPEDRERVEAAYKQIIYEHAVPDLEYRIVRNDGKIRYLLQKAKLVTVEQELLVSGIIQDITVQRQLEKKVAGQAEVLQIRSLLAQQSDEQANLFSWVMSLDENTISWSESFYRLIGYTKAQPTNITEKTLHSLLHPQDAKAFRTEWNRVQHERQATSFAVRFLLRGSVQYMKAVFSISRVGEKDYFIGIVQNTTAEQVLQQQLSQRVQLAESLSENMPDRVFITDVHNTVLLWSHSCEQAYGIRKAEAIGENFFDLFPQLKTEAELQMLQRVLRGERVVLQETASALGKGRYNLYLIPLYRESEVTSVLHIIHDVTKEVELRNRLNQRLGLIESLVQSSVDRIIALDKNLNYLYWNKSAEDYYGIPKEAVLGKNILEVFPRLVNDPSYTEIRRALRGEAIHLPVNAEAGSYSETYLIPIKDERGDVASLLWMAHDLSKEWGLQQEQRQAQERLAEEHRRLKEAQAIGHIGSFEWDRATDRIHWSDEMYRIHGLEPQSEEITLERVMSFMHPGETEEVKERLRRLREESGTVCLTHWIVRADGKERFVVRNIQSFADENGHVTGLSGTLQDITEQAVMKETLQQMLDGSISAICLFDALRDESGKIIDFVFRGANKAAEKLNRLTTEEMIGRRLLALFPGVKESFFADYVNVVETGVPLRLQKFYPQEHYADWFDVSAVKNGDGFIMTFHNITAQKKAEEELQHSKAFIEEITQTIPDLITIHDAATNQIIYANNDDFWGSFFEIGEVYTLRDKQRAAAMIHADDLEKAGEFLKERRLLEDHAIIEVELKMKTGRWIRIRSKVFKRDGQGNASQIISFTSDITERKDAEAGLQKSFAILQNAESIAEMGSWEFDIATGRFYWSEGMYRLFGLPQGSRVSPETYLDFSVEEDRSIAKRIVKNLVKGHQSFEETMQIKRGDGRRQLKIKGSVVSNEKGEVQKLIGVDVDITAVKEAQQKVEESRNLLEQTALASPDAITIYNLQTKQPVYLNNCLAEWIGYTNKELVDMGIDGRLRLVHPDDRLNLLHFNEKLKKAEDGAILTLEYRILRADGTLRWVRNRSRIFLRNAGGEVTHSLSILQDVTEEKAAEQVLKSLNASLEKKNQELESKNEEITSFAFVASHDLREPLRKIHTFSDWLLQMEPNLSEAGKQNLQKMTGSVKRLELLISDVLALTKVHAGNEAEKTVDLNLLFKQIREEMQERLQKTGAVVEVTTLPAITGVENQLFYLFKNLLNNAIKFQPEGNLPRIRIHAAQEDAFIKVSVTDNGLGIAPEHHKKVFEVFRRLHTREAFEGTGMGLAICKKIMEKHGGRITVASEPGKGATFTCWFPVRLSTENPA